MITRVRTCVMIPLCIHADLYALEIREDIEAECGKFGKIISLKIPRPVGGSRQSAGVGKIYIKFDTPESATKALKALAGRKFSDRTVVTTYFSEVSPATSQLVKTDSN